jgi:hypothetical protein
MERLAFLLLGFALIGVECLYGHYGRYDDDAMPFLFLEDPN